MTELHAKQKELYGVDNLSVKEAYTQAFEHRSGYIRGLGAGPMPLRNKKDNEIEASLRQQIEELKHSNALREENLRLEMEKMKEIAEERERKLREEVEERERKLRADADEATQKLKAEMMQVVRDQIAGFLGTQQSSQLTKLV